MRYVANTYGMPFANFRVDDGRVAANVKEFTSFTLRTGLRFNVTYVPLLDDFVRKYALPPAVSIRDRRGAWLVLGVFLLAGLVVSRPSRQAKSR